MLDTAIQSSNLRREASGETQLMPDYSFSISLGDLRAAGSGSQIVAVMQPTEPWRRSNPSTYAWILLRRTGGESFHLFDSLHLFVDVCAPIKDPVAGCRAIAECLAQLLYNPSATWMFDGVEVQNPSPIIRNGHCNIVSVPTLHRSGVTRYVPCHLPAPCYQGNSC